MSANSNSGNNGNNGNNSSNAPVIEAKRSGVYRAPASVSHVREQAKKIGLVWLDLPLNAVSTQKQFLDVCARQLKLPSYFGANWDALADCVRDFNWLKGAGFVLHIAGHGNFAKAAPDDYQTALAVLTEAAVFWKEKGTPFVVLVDGAAELPSF
jgi:Barstar (barnase inhibitor)